MAAAFSVKSVFTNGLPVTLELHSYGLSHGETTENPPFSIAPGGTGEWQSDSNAFATGTEGTCVYQFVYIGASEPSIQSVKLYWDNPFNGGNGYSITCSEPSIKTGWSEGSGDNATVHYTIGG